MAEKIVAINAYRPKVKLGKRAELKEIVEIIAGRNTLNEGQVYLALKEFRDVVVYLCKVGRSAYIEGLGTYVPKISIDGTYSVSHRLHTDIKDELNKNRAFQGELMNRDNIGKTVDELVTLWNTDNPDDQVTP